MQFLILYYSPVSSLRFLLFKSFYLMANFGGAGLNQTRKLHRSDPNTLYFKAYRRLLLAGFEMFLKPPILPGR